MVIFTPVCTFLVANLFLIISALSILSAISDSCCDDFECVQRTPSPLGCVAPEGPLRPATVQTLLPPAPTPAVQLPRALSCAVPIRPRISLLRAACAVRLIPWDISQLQFFKPLRYLLFKNRPPPPPPAIYLSCLMWMLNSIEMKIKWMS